jgi:hypothetical protein
VANQIPALAALIIVILQSQLFKQQNTMKKQVKRITLKTDKIVNLSHTQAMNVQGGRPAGCPTSRVNQNGIITCYD